MTGAGLAEGWLDSDSERFRARAVLIACGTRPQRLAAATDGAFGGDITYHLERDPDRFTGRPVVVIGGGDSATLDALALAPTASSVVLAHRSSPLTARQDIVAQLRAEPRIEDLAGWELESAHGTDRLEEVVLAHPATGERRTIPAGGLVVKISRDPSTETFRGQLDLDRRGFIVVDGDLRTSCPGVFAAGDVVSGAYWRVASALGQGSLVSRTILHYLQDESQPGDPTAAVAARHDARRRDGASPVGRAGVRPFGARRPDRRAGELQQQSMGSEDTTRDPDISDAVVATAKREIDRLNLGRHRLVQEIDAAVDAALEQPAVAPIATESPGMVLDRLSVLVIRRVRTAAASARDQAFAERLPVLDAQIATLSAAFDFYLEELGAGSRRFVPYEQLKLYAPSALTPEW